MTRPLFWRRTGEALGGALGPALLIWAWRGTPHVSFVEAIGFVTGAACVYLVVRESVWNFPWGTASVLAFFVLFARDGLYGDAGLQVVFLLLNLQGWWSWLRGDRGGGALEVRSAPVKVLAGTGAVVVALAGALVPLLGAVGGNARALDAITTALSLGAQWLLNRKYVENWWFWMVADVIYVGLYVSRELYLTALLYVVFFAMCLAGLPRWRALARANEEKAPS